MHRLPADSVARLVPNDAEKARDRLNRVAAASPTFARPIRGEDAPYRPALARHGTGKREGFRLGWVGWLVVDVAAGALILCAVFVWPPVSACRQQAERVGFYAGDTLGKCIHRGIATRIDDADQRIKMAFRGSGK